MGGKKERRHSVTKCAQIEGDAHSGCKTLCSRVRRHQSKEEERQREKEIKREDKVKERKIYKEREELETKTRKRNLYV